MTRPRSVLAAAVLATVLLPASPALAAEVGSIGWWTRSPSQQAPEGGFAVGAAPDGPVSVAAASVDLGSNGVERATLRAVETGGLGQAAATLQVCPTEELWQPVAGGSMADAPAPDCERASAPFERNEATSTWEADVTGIVQDGTGSMGLMVVPGGPSEDVGPSTLFEVRFAAPDFDAVERAAAGPADEEATDQPDAPPAPREPAADDDPAPADGQSGSSIGSRSLTPAPPPGPGSGTTGAPTSSATPAPAASGAPDTADTRPVADRSSSDQDAGVAAPLIRTSGSDAEGSRWGQALLFVVLSAVVATGTALTQRWLRLR